MSSYRESLGIQARVVQALLMREVLTRYGRHNIGFMWLFVEPMIFTLGISALWYATKATHGSNLPIVAFSITGYSSILLWRNMPARCIGAIQPNLALMFHRNVRVIDIYIARLTLEICGTTISFMTLTTVFCLLGMMSPPEDLGTVVVGWLLLAWFGCALAVLIGTWSERSDLVEKIWHPFAYLLFPLSGAVFMVSWLPQQAQEFVLFLPMVHCVEFIREGFFGSQVTAHYSLTYVVLCNVAITFAALTQERVVSQNVIPE